MTGSVNGSAARPRAGTCVPGELLCLVAARFPVPGRHVTVDAGSQSLRITGEGIRDCRITVEDSGYVLLDYYPATAGHTDPAELAARVMAVLDGGRDDWRPGTENLLPGEGNLPGAVGRQLRAAGLDVILDVFVDRDNFDVFARIAVTKPGSPGRGNVRVGGDGVLVWECQYPADASKRTIAEAVTTVLARVIPPGAMVPDPGRRTAAAPGHRPGKRNA